MILGRPQIQISTLTYSRSITITLTHDCPWHCAYCGFRTEKEGLISDQAITELLSQAQAQGAREALLIAGENPEQLPHIKEELKRRGFSNFLAFAYSVAERALKAGLWPHGNYGALSQLQLEYLRPVHVSMGVMLENTEDRPEIAPEKKSVGRLKTLEAAGLAKVAFTSGILIGLGESVQSRFESLDALARTHQRHGQLQEILIQNYIPNAASRHKLPASTPSLEEYLDLISYWQKLCPAVPVQIPPNLNPHWHRLLPFIQDLGGISANRDEVNPLNPWAPALDYETAALSYRRVLKERLAVYASHCVEEWVDKKLLSKILSKDSCYILTAS